MALDRGTLLIALGGGLLAYGLVRSTTAAASIAPAAPLGPAMPPPASPPADLPKDPSGGTFPQDPASPPGYATPPHIIMQTPPPSSAPSGVAKPWHLSLAERAAIKGIELLRLTKYPDGSGYSIGWGHHIVPADNIGTTITTARAQALFNSDIATVERALNTLVHVPLDQNEIDALGDFVFNLGWGTFARSPLLSKLNAGDYHGAAGELAAYHYSSGTSNATLVERRRIEAEQFERGLSYG